MENKIPIIVFNILRKGTLRKLLVEGERTGTLVS
jgi:uridylate kinase